MWRWQQSQVPFVSDRRQRPDVPTTQSPLAASLMSDPSGVWSFPSDKPVQESALISPALDFWMGTQVRGAGGRAWVPYSPGSPGCRSSPLPGPPAVVELGPRYAQPLPHGQRVGCPLSVTEPQLKGHSPGLTQALSPSLPKRGPSRPSGPTPIAYNQGPGHHPTVRLPTGPPIMDVHRLGCSLLARFAPSSAEDRNARKPPAPSALPLPISWPLPGLSRWRRL